MQKAKGLEYEIHGEGQPVLLIHGSHVADAFLPLTRETILTDRYQLIRYHRRGFAGSDPHTGTCSIAEQAQDALALLEALGVARVHVIGHSYGAVTALQLTYEAPSVVHALVLLEPPKTIAGTGRFEVFEPLIAQYRSGDVNGAVDAFMALVGGLDWRIEVQHTVPGGPEQAETDAATFFEVELPALGAWTFNADQARRLSQPILYIVGSESGPHFDRAKVAFQATVTQTEAVVLPGLNHLLQMRNPHVVAAPIADFLACHPL
ncbi:MAG: alpha/beta hydrolase [candidate division KSB1 bacterium]|nr:alpha/beta hydrolase [candidate division KSB1 bacterium]